MKLVTKPAISILLPLLFFYAKGVTQDSLAMNKEYNYTYSSDTGSLFNRHVLNLSPDSLITKKLMQTVLLPDSGSIRNYFSSITTASLSYPAKPFLKTGGGYISYNWTWRSGNDSSVIDNNVSQHLVSGSFNATIAQLIPVRVTYFERHSNSRFFKDYRDITVDVDVQKYRQLKTQRALTNLKNAYEKKQDPRLPLAMQSADSKAKRYKSFLNDPSVISELIRSKETLIRTDYSDTSVQYIDSVTNRARKFIALYDTVRSQQARYEQMKDSLGRLYKRVEASAAKMEQLFSSKTLSEAETKQLENIYGAGDKNVQQLRQSRNGLKKLSVGRTYPNFSNLTLQDVNVNGINLEYGKGRYYLAAAAGLVDFRIRDFLYSQQKLPRQYVYAVRAGYGSRESDHIILTYFRGRKQLFGGNLQTPSTEIQGISLSAQYFITRNTRIYGEVAQSGIPYALGGNNASKPVIALKDNSQRAYAGGFNTSLFHGNTYAEGYYQHSGLNYQSFNSFQYNATANSWFFRIEQSVWKRQLRLQAAFRKNDFINPLVLQRYNANTIFKSFTATFYRYKWPVLSVGYMPASQYTLVGNLVYENHYQTFTGNISHQYKLGMAEATTLFSFSRFYNDNRDSGFIYYNSKNFFFGQTFLFNRFTASLNISGMSNGRHDLIVMEESFSANLFKTVNAGFGIKINNLNRTINKLGFNAKARASIKGVGELNLWMEQSYLPGLQQEFYKYEMYNAGLVRYFK